MKEERQTKIIFLVRWSKSITSRSQGVKNQLAELEKILTCETPILQHNLRCPTKTEEEVSDAIFDEATTSMTSESTEVTTSLSEEGLQEIRRKTPEEHLISALFDVERIQESNIEGL